jgi:flagellar basal-body rod modification protein FlgD
MMSPLAPATNAATTAGGSGGNAAAPTLAERDTFLKLLVAQVRYQDPLSPQEPIEFVSQLAQFSQLETLLSMRTSLASIEQSLAGSPPAAEEAGGS